MKIFNGFDQLSEIPNPVLTIGTFDGVHLGHQKILRKLNEEAERLGGESVLFTFYPHPRMVLYPDSHGVKMIQTQTEKLDKLRACGLQNIIVFPFTMEFSRLTALEFVRDFLVNKLNVKHLVIGYDHQFGKNREGGIEFLKEVAELYDFGVTEIGPKDVDEVNVSSTKIRNALKEGDIEVANAFLGEPFELHAKVVRGKGIGKTIGFPTANLDPESEVKIIPGSGVYMVEVLLEEQHYEGLLNIGTNPTIDDDNKKTIELYILDFSKDIYEKQIEVRFLKRIRAEQKFENIDQLVNQIKQDELEARTFFAAIHSK